MRSCRLRKLVTLATALAVVTLPDIGRGSRSSRRPLHSPQPLAIWIDHEQIERLVGIQIGMDIFIVRNAAVVPYLRDGLHRDAQLPVLPPEVTRIEVTWMAEDDLYLYKFTELRSLDPAVLYDPLTSIVLKGTVPKTPTSFHLSFPCTMNVTAIATMHIVLHLESKTSGRRVNGSPLAFSLRKRCEAATPNIGIPYRKRKPCSCQNGGECDAQGRCLCRIGYSGARCELRVHHPQPPVTCGIVCQNGGKCIGADVCECPRGIYGDLCQYRTGECRIPCINGGTCTSLNVCACPDGYRGIFCQKPICRRWCGVHGKCVGSNQCQCHRGWRGKLCNRTLNRPHSEQDTVNSNKLSRRKRLKVFRQRRRRKAHRRSVSRRRRRSRSRRANNNNNNNNND